MTEEVTRLDVDSMSKAYCAQFEVTFNGKRQSHCLVADAKRGYIKRYRYLFGVLARDRANRPMTEELYGRVTITRKSK